MCSCGTSKFALMDLDDPPPPPKAPKKKHNKNPYAACGLDKFSKVLAELESRREKIVSITGPQALIRFVYDNTHDWVPIIVRSKPAEKKKLGATTRPEIKKSTKKGAVVEKRRMKGSDEKRLPWLGLRSGSCYYDMLLVMVVVLGGVVVFGRVFAICCTCVWWYMMPVLMKEKGVNNKRKEYGMKLIEG